MTFDWSQGALAQGLRDYNAGNYFEAHESWEAVWITCHGPEKALLQGLIQVAAAFHHYQRGNLLGTQRTFEKALRRLDSLPAEFCGIAVALLRNDIQDRLDKLQATPPPAATLAPARILLVLPAN